jgi:hypothetical protein
MQKYRIDLDSRKAFFRLRQSSGLFSSTEEHRGDAEISCTDLGNTLYTRLKLPCYAVPVGGQMPIQITLMTTSKPLLSPPSYLKLHIPSVFSFQYAPVALCIPLRPTWGLPSVLVASVLISLVVTDASVDSELASGDTV